MEQINVVNIPFYKFKADKGLVEVIKTETSSLKYMSENTLENGYVYPNFYHNELFKFFNKSIEQVKNLYYKSDIEFPIVDCWVNKYTTLNRLNKHKHSNSVICGLYYVTSHTDLGATFFEDKNPWNFENSNGINLSINKENTETIHGSIFPEEGTLVLFPSNIAHYMRPIQKISTVRYTIAFNTFPTGVISNWRSSKLSIQVKGND